MGKRVELDPLGGRVLYQVPRKRLRVLRTGGRFRAGPRILGSARRHEHVKTGVQNR